MNASSEEKQLSNFAFTDEQWSNICSYLPNSPTSAQAIRPMLTAMAIEAISGELKNRANRNFIGTKADKVAFDKIIKSAESLKNLINARLSYGLPVKPHKRNSKTIHLEGLNNPLIVQGLNLVIQAAKAEAEYIQINLHDLKNTPRAFEDAAFKTTIYAFKLGRGRVSRSTDRHGDATGPCSNFIMAVFSSIPALRHFTIEMCRKRLMHALFVQRVGQSNFSLEQIQSCSPKKLKGKLNNDRGRKRQKN